MFDDLRSQVTPFDEDGEPIQQPTRPAGRSKTPGGRTGRSATAKTASATAAPVATARRVVRKRKKAPGETPLLGLTAVQRFVLSVMMFMLIAVFGIVLLLVTKSVVLPI